MRLHIKIGMGGMTIEKAFGEWTEGLTPREARISVYSHIRDIPYAIIPELRDPVTGPIGMLEQNRGSCQPKHWLLGIMLRKLGMHIKYATYPFKWKDQPIFYPPELKKLAQELPVSYHLACKAFINDKWRIIDATWDKPLAKYGFPVNVQWDGVSDTLNAVNPVEEVVHASVDERVRYEAACKARYTEKEKTMSTEFIDKLNAWLREAR